MDRESRKSTGVAFVLAVYAASRLFYLISGSLLAYLVPTSSFQRATLDVPSGSMNIWSHWDGEHYVRLAMGGYLHPLTTSPRLSSPCIRCFSDPSQSSSAVL